MLVRRHIPPYLEAFYGLLIWASLFAIGGGGYLVVRWLLQFRIRLPDWFMYGLVGLFALLAIQSVIYVLGLVIALFGRRS